MDAAGNLFGTTEYGEGVGTLFELDKTGMEVVSIVLLNYPLAGLIRDRAGNFYGTTSAGGGPGKCGHYGCGTVFKVSPNTFKVVVLHHFRGGNDQISPGYGPLVRDAAGTLYGTTLGGIGGCCGTVFKIDKARKLTVLHTFAGGADGLRPAAGVIRDEQGNLYGTTSEAGTVNSNCPFGCGTLFKIDPSGKETVLHSFTGGADGEYPLGALVRDGVGNLYGPTVFGGNGNCPQEQLGCGTVFKLDTSGNETVLYSFTGGADGAFPQAGFVRDTAGNLYGTAKNGGNLNCTVYKSSGCGVVFKLDATGKETVLYTFSGADGAGPAASLLRDKKGNLYGTTLSGGNGYGVVFKLTP
jgi:uncharacterized repeat protein (TIGR03803 family)